MRLFQNSALYRGYLPRLRRLTRGLSSFEELRDAFLGDRFGAPHFLSPVLEGKAEAFFTNGDDPDLQGAWAAAKGLPRTTALEDILLAQIEDHRTEVFYNLDPVRYPTAFLQRLPSCVRRKVAWRAAPLAGADLAGYDLVVSNFPEILGRWRDLGLRTGELFPAHDPVLDDYATQTDRPIDVLFVGGYTRHHRRRAEVLESVAALQGAHSVVYCLDRSRLTRIAETPVGLLPPLNSHRRPAGIRRISREPVYGRDLYATLASARVVINCAIDMAGGGRGNMRCFETMGAGALLVSDAGDYPPGMTPDETLLTYESPEQAREQVEVALSNPTTASTLARRGYELVAGRYSKKNQYDRFVALTS